MPRKILTEGQGSLLTYMPEANILLERWSNYLSAVNEAFGASLPIDRQVVLAVCLEATQQQINRVENLYEATQPTDIGPFKKFGLELVTAVVPNLIANDIVSVQPMANKIGEVRYIKYLYGSNKGKVAAGQEYNSFQKFSGGNFNYSSEIVEEESIGESGETSYTGNLSWIPIRPGTVEFKVGSTVLKDNGAGVVTGTGLTTGTINYTTGAYSLTFAQATTADITVDYEFNLEQAPVNSPEFQLKIETMPVTARSRKLKALYAFDAAYDLQRDYGVEINTALVGQIAAEIKHEIDGEILDDLLAAASGLTITDFQKTPPEGIDVDAHYRSFYTKIIEGGNKIFKATKRASANFLVMGVGVADIVESMSQFRSAGAVSPVGPHLVGYLNNIPCYKNPYYPDNEYIVGFKGETLFDAGYIYCPYMPVMTTSLLLMDDFVGRRGFATSYGKKLVNSNLYAKGRIVTTTP